MYTYVTFSVEAEVITIAWMCMCMHIWWATKKKNFSSSLKLFCFECEFHSYKISRETNTKFIFFPSRVSPEYFAETYNFFFKKSPRLETILRVTREIRGKKIKWKKKKKKLSKKSAFFKKKGTQTHTHTHTRQTTIFAE